MAKSDVNKHTDVGFPIVTIWLLCTPLRHGGIFHWRSLHRPSHLSLDCIGLLNPTVVQCSASRAVFDRRICLHTGRQHSQMTPPLTPHSMCLTSHTSIHVPSLVSKLCRLSTVHTADRPVGGHRDRANDLPRRYSHRTASPESRIAGVPSGGLSEIIDH